MTFRPLLLLAAFAMLPGCATMDEGECRTADWYETGRRDGVNGEPASRLHEHTKACAEYGIRPQERRYYDGRTQGLMEYCRFDNAFQTGLKGQRYQGVCPAAIDRDFNRFNEAAYEVYQLRNEVESTRSSQDDKERRLREKKLSDEQRDSLRREIRELDRKLDRLRDDLRYRERELDRMMDDARDRKRFR
jgi:hypothetical protein